MVVNDFHHTVAQDVCAGHRIDKESALLLHDTPTHQISELLAGADVIRRHFKGNKVSLCSIVNAKSGRCPEDCAFCSQSIHHACDIPVFPLLSDERIAQTFKSASLYPIDRFGIVISGRGLRTGGELTTICSAIKRLRQLADGITICASLGILTRDIAAQLRQSGLQTYHHNLETSASLFHLICTTHSFDDRVKTVRTAKEAGFKVCCGGIFGLGESAEDRVELALMLRELDVDSVPLNFLMPIPGTKLAHAPALKSLEILKIIALFRYMLPDKDIRICGGREKHLRDLQSLIFFAGANAMMLGNYLTAKGRPPEEDIHMLADLELETVRT